MSECGVCIGDGDYDCAWDFYNEKIVKARKDHKCYECHREIKCGRIYHYASGKSDGDFCDFHTCIDCHNIRTGLACDGNYPIGNLWGEIYESFEGLTSTACLTKIPTASAKAYFLERWRKWKGIA